MDKATRQAAVAGEIDATIEAIGSALNNLDGPHGVRYRSAARDFYWAAFHMASALLADRGLTARSHDATQQMLATHFVRAGALPADTARRYNQLMERRHTADYKPSVPVDATDIAEFRDWLCDFIQACAALLVHRPPRKAQAALSTLLDALRNLRLDRS